ncbi:MAG: YbfB/YjiJ family MFS transporter [Chloroflexi bacterium]|nr:YbfB/YjiJ family MFS transporter [Chloroflexota bacterium]
MQVPPRFHYAYIVLALCVLAVFGSLGAGRFGYGIILPAMQDALKLSNTQTGELQSWNLLGYSLGALFVGALTARFGARRVISTSLFVGSLAIFATGYFPFFDTARVSRFIVGLSNAGANIIAMALVSAWFAARRRGIAAGIATAGVSLGLIVTGPLIPAILNAYGAEGWRVSWYALGGIALAVSILGALFLRNRPEEMGLMPVGADANVRDNAGGKNSAPFDGRALFKSRLLWHLAAIYFAFGFSYIIYATFFIRYLIGERAFSTSEAGALWFQVGAVSIISGLMWGAVSDRWSRRAALISVFAAQGAAFLLFGASHELIAIYFSAGLFALTAWSVPALMAAIAGDLFGARGAPAVLGWMTVVFGAGQAIGPWLAGAIADATQSFSIAFIIAGVAALFGMLGSLALRAK